MPSKKSQTELEQPAKVYQVDAVEVKVDTMLVQLDTILKRTNGLVTNAQLDAVKQDFKEKLDEAISDLHKEIDPKLQRNDWLYKTVIGQALGLLGAAIAVIFLTKG